MSRPPRPRTDPLRRGTVTFRQHGVGVELVTAEGVFSAAGIDPGTAFLLRWIAGTTAGRVLDIGCGYGPIALWLGAADAGRTVVAVDRDAVAVECTLAGADANGIRSQVEAHGSLGYDDVVPEGFDLVVSNVPAKVGAAALGHLLLDAWFHLRPGGEVAVVAVARLAAEVAAILDDPAVEVAEHRANRGYGVWRYRFRDRPAGADERPGFDRGVYRRGLVTFGTRRVRWDAMTSTTLPEFDTLHHATVAAVEALESEPLGPGAVAVLGVGQGHTAAAVRATAPGATLRLVDRDLLALRTAAANSGAAELVHAAWPARAVTGCTAAVAALPEKQPVAVTAAVLAPALRELPPGAPVVLHGRSTDVGRVLDLLGPAGCRLAVEDRRVVRNGSAVLAVTPPA